MVHRYAPLKIVLVAVLVRVLDEKRSKMTGTRTRNSLLIGRGATEAAWRTPVKMGLLRCHIVPSPYAPRGIFMLDGTARLINEAELVGAEQDLGILLPD